MTDDIRPSVRENYDRIADEYVRSLFGELENKPLDRQLLERFASDVADDGKVCDLGCGPGQVARYLHTLGAPVVGIDISSRMIEHARRLTPEIQFIEGDMMALPFEDASLAGIAAFYAIVNIPEQSLPLVFQEMERVLQPGGLVLLSFHIGNEVRQVEELFGQAVSMEFFFFEPSLISEYVESAGLKLKKSSSASHILPMWNIKAGGRIFSHASLSVSYFPNLPGWG